MKQKKKWLIVLMLVMMLVLTACGQSNGSSNSGFWSKYIVGSFVWAIQKLSIGGNIGVGIILFTIVVKIILLPLNHFQNKSMRKTQEMQPQLKKIQEKYPGKDAESKRLMQEEQQKLYDENGVNPMAGCLPLLVQMPILMALYNAVSQNSLKTGHFLWMELGKPDPYFILPILAGLFTLISSKLTSMGQVEKNGATTVMTYFMPLMIVFIAINNASGLSLYWVVSNAFQVIQVLLINNPFVIRREREEKQRKEKRLARELDRAQNPQKQKRNK